MVNKISVGIDLFAMDQKITLTSEDGVPQMSALVPMDRVGETVAALASQHDVSEIHLFGSKQALAQTAYDTQTYINKLFSENNNVRIFINGEIFN